MRTPTLRQRLEAGPVIVAEGYLFELERRGYLKAGPFVPEVVLQHPDAVLQLHLEFLRAGSDATVAFTYYGHRAKMRAAGLEERLEELNRTALQLAARAADQEGGLVAGNICNTWEYDPDDPVRSRDAVRAIFDEQVAWAADEGADFIIAETFSHLGEALIALESVKQAGLPAVVTFIQTREKTCDGHDFGEACRILEDAGADVVGLNCGRGPDTMIPALVEIRDAVQGQVAALPVPYRTTQKMPTVFQLRRGEQKAAFPLALDPFLLDRFETAAFARAAVDMGVQYVGLCCGGAPHHIRAMAEALGRTPPASLYSPDMDMHPAFGRGLTAAKEHFRECWYVPEEE
jgi:betaine-homocysteine S-methyltransferase